MIAKVQGFIGEVLAEMKKVSWSTRRELLDSTLIVIFSSLLLGIFIASVDIFLSKGVTLLLK
jgi:preprotein translocase subunit SecE